MNDVEKIRAALKAAPAGGLSPDALKSAAGVGLRGRMKALTQSGEVLRHKDGSYELNPKWDGTNAAPRSAQKGGGKRPKRFKGFVRSREDRTKLRAMLAKAKASASAAAELQALTLESVLSSSRHLADMVREHVEDYSDSKPLTHALDSFERAERVHRTVAAR